VVSEEVYLKRPEYSIEPLRMVGFEGMWGALLMLPVLVIVFFIPGSDGSTDSYENVFDSVVMLGHNGWLLAFVIGKPYAFELDCYADHAQSYAEICLYLI